MVGATRFEHATPCSQSRCSTRLSYAPTPDFSAFTRRAVKIDVLLIDCSSDLDPTAGFFNGRSKPVERFMPHIILFPNNASWQRST